MDVRLTEHVAWREIDGETFVIDLKARKMYGLNASGGRVWHGLEQGQGVSTIVQDLAPSADGEVSTCVSRALESFFGELRELGLVSCDRPLESDSSDLPLDQFVPPQVVWQEELRSFGFSCGLQAGQSPACSAAPTT